MCIWSSLLVGRSQRSQQKHLANLNRVSTSRETTFTVHEFKICRNISRQPQHVFQPSGGNLKCVSMVHFVKSDRNSDVKNENKKRALEREAYVLTWSGRRIVFFRKVSENKSSWACMRQPRRRDALTSDGLIRAFLQEARTVDLPLIGFTIWPCHGRTVGVRAAQYIVLASTSRRACMRHIEAQAISRKTH